LRSIR